MAALDEPVSEQKASITSCSSPRIFLLNATVTGPGEADHWYFGQDPEPEFRVRVRTSSGTRYIGGTDGYTQGSASCAEPPCSSYTAQIPGGLMLDGMSETDTIRLATQEDDQGVGVSRIFYRRELLAGGLEGRAVPMEDRSGDSPQQFRRHTRTHTLTGNGYTLTFETISVCDSPLAGGLEAHVEDPDAVGVQLCEEIARQSHVLSRHYSQCVANPYYARREHLQQAECISDPAFSKELFEMTDALYLQRITDALDRKRCPR